ncbi:MAG TPA: hypothetical protein VE988_06720 [Gemmataceae bacterium]|nr:hypothetical protein [Gemmataceae bacterium]
MCHPRVSFCRSAVATLILAGPCLLLFVSQSGAQDKTEKSVAAQPASKKVYIIPDLRPMNIVLDWLKDESGLPLVGSGWPIGTFRTTSPFEPLTSLDEVLDAINTAIAERKQMLVRTETFIMNWHADEPFPPELAKLITAKDWNKMGRTQVAKTRLTLRNMEADKVAAFAKPLLGPWGAVFPSENGKEIVLLDTVANLRKITPLLADYDAHNTRSGVPRDSWKNTLDWLSARTGLPLAAKVMPVKPLAGAWADGERLVRTEEVIDLLNEALVEQKLLILRGERALHVVWTDEAIDPVLVPHVKWAELAERGKTEVVSINVMFKKKDIAALVEYLSPMLSPFGRAEKVADDELVLQDTVANLQTILWKAWRIGSIKK